MSFVVSSILRWRVLVLRFAVTAGLACSAWHAVDARAHGAATASPADAAARETRSEASRRYVLTIEARDDLRELLQRYLEIAKREDEADIDRDALSILVERSQRQTRELLSTEGYFSPTVTVTVDDAVQPWPVKIVVREGDPVRIGTVEIEFTGEQAEAARRVYDARQLEKRWPLKSGARFRQGQWDAGKTALLREFVSDTFAAARISSSEARIDPEGHRATLKVEIDPGRPYVFGATRIIGVQKYPEFLVTQTKPIAVGSPYRQSKLLDLQSALQSMPYFRTAVVTADLSEAVGNVIPVEIHVAEARQYRVELGAGVSSNFGPRVQVGFSDVDVRDRGWMFDSRLQVDQLEQRVGTSLRFPTDQDGWNDGLFSNLKHDDIKHLDTRSALLSIRHERKDPSAERGWSVNYLWSDERPDGAGEREVHAFYPAWTWTRRGLDDLQYPRRGYVFNIQLAAAVKGLMTTESFVRSYARLVTVFPVGKRDSLQLRAEGGAVLTRDPYGVPEDLRFRIGGDQSLRGYGYQSIGIPLGEATVGARYTVMGGAEYTHWISRNWGVGVFAETGDAYNAPFDYHSHTGIGLGPRWRSPIGPINIDVAYGVRTHNVLLHFSLGFVF